MTPSLADLIQAGAGRRTVLLGLPALVAGVALKTPSLQAHEAASTLDFPEVASAIEGRHRVPAGYTARALLRWGDPVTTDAPAFDPHEQRADAQERQVGFNCDYVGFLTLPPGSEASDHGILVINHESSDPVRMFPGTNPLDPYLGLSAEQVAVELAAHGVSVIEIRREGGRWNPVAGSPYNRRVTLRSTEILVAGPAAGHPRMRTAADPTGTRVLGTIANCSGGITPWGTFLSGEENFNQYFAGDPRGTAQEQAYRSVGIAGTPEYHWWAEHEPRFHIGHEPNEPNRFGWVVEIDPFDRAAAPVKRTALGRFKHEAATIVVNPDGRIVVYSGDDQQFAHLYKFVSAGVLDRGDRAANGGLLDEGTLFAAVFHDDGTLEWRPLVYGSGPLVPANSFYSQADVVIDARRAARLVGATRMDRPEDVETNPATGRVYVVLTMNTDRTRSDQNAANPRAHNTFGHILEIEPPGGVGPAADHAAAVATWRVFLLGGDPADPRHGARYGEGVSADGWVANPDNIAFDPFGRLWIATDGAADSAGHAEGLFACDTDGPGRAVTRRFFSGPHGGEVCGPCFTPDGTTLFLSIQHPGELQPPAFTAATTGWPDFTPGMPPRPAVVAITRDDGGPIGGAGGAWPPVATLWARLRDA